MNLRPYALCLLVAAAPAFRPAQALSRAHQHAKSVVHAISSAELKRSRAHRVVHAKLPSGAPQTQAAPFATLGATSLAKVETPNPGPADVWASPLPDSTLDQSVYPSGAALRGNGSLPDTIRSFAQPATQTGAPTLVLPAPAIVRPAIVR